MYCLTQSFIVSPHASSFSAVYTGLWERSQGFCLRMYVEIHATSFWTCQCLMTFFMNLRALYTNIYLHNSAYFCHMCDSGIDMLECLAWGMALVCVYACVSVCNRDAWWNYAECISTPFRFFCKTRTHTTISCFCDRKWLNAQKSELKHLPVFLSTKVTRHTEGTDSTEVR